jgi:hypothetical protein
MTQKILESNALILFLLLSHCCLHLYSWSLERKWGTTIIVSAFTFIGSISSSIIAPTSKQLAERFEIHNNVLLAITTSVFILAHGVYPPMPFTAFINCMFSHLLAFGPLFLGPLSEIHGRSPLLQLSNLWFIGISFVFLPDSR